MSTVDFKQVMSDAGVPVTEDTALAKFREIVAAENAPFNNQSAMSPFWRLVSLLFVKPFMWLVDLLHAEILPALFLKTASGEWVDTFAWQLELERKPATKAKGMITLSRYDASGSLAVPVGTVIQSAPIAGRVYRLEVIEQGEFTPGDSSIDVLCEAVETGSAYNLATGFYALIATDISGIASISNAADWLITPGADEETDDELKARCRNQFSAVNRWNVDAVYKGLVAEYAGIGVGDIYIEHDAPRGPGTANIYILGDEDGTADEFYQNIRNRIYADGSHGLGDDVQILAMPTQNIEQSATVRLKDFNTETQKTALIANIYDFISVALRAMPTSIGYHPTLTMPFKQFAWSQLIHELHVQFPDLLSIDFANDTDVDCQMWIPKLVNLSLKEATA